ncbi:MAG TPA: sulfatase-like hydrolase/transferase [Solirubrobacteraceae bacterium]|nr:sulfatase-like hydrolase/transferase [Solirubrobacteraceae bacterium]
MRADEDKKIDRIDDDRGLDRRTFIRRSLIAGGSLLGGGLAIAKLADANDGSSPPAPARAPAHRTAASKRPVKPNVLVIMVDQLRYPQWLGAGPGELELPPNMQQLGKSSVSFANYYTASNDCTPSRAALLTGLYTHQTGCMITGASTLSPGFPTWGTMLREHGYDTRWYGKWHLTHGDNKWTSWRGPRELERYGFAGGTYPSPDGAPGQGWRVDPGVAGDFERWLSGLPADGGQPWCTTVSFVNPHDIAWWYRWTDRVPSEATAPSVATQLPANFETPEQLIAEGKPRLQLSLQETAAASFGPMPFAGPGAEQAWLGMLDLYVKLQNEVDRHVGRILEALKSRSKIAENTVVIVTSDHGEYCGSHGLRGKGAGAYDEAIRVPLLVSDPRGQLTSEPDVQREQLSSSVDLAPLLLTIASGSNEWRSQSRYAHIAGRLDLAGVLADPNAPGREYVLHATDETVTEFAIEPYSANAPLHVIALRTQDAKYATYSNWEGEGMTPLAEGQERELYDYSEESGRMEVHNSANESPLEGAMKSLLEEAFVQELRQPLPGPLRRAQTKGLANYFTVAARSTLRAYERREAELAAAGRTSALRGGRASDRRAGSVQRLHRDERGSGG